MDEMGTAAVPDVRFGFGHDLDAPRQARDALARMFGDDHDPFTDDVRLAASELVTNVILHTADGGELRAYEPQHGGSVRLEVEDHERMEPHRRRAATHQIDGRGLHIVAEVSRRWGVSSSCLGKVVWAEFDRPLD